MNAEMKKYFKKWNDAVKVRRSRRKFTGEPVEENKIFQLDDFCSTLNSAVNGARVAMVKAPTDEIFTGIIGSYGKIKDAPLCVAFLGDIRDDNYQEKTGYLGESFILEATAMGLSTCWVAGFFSPEKLKRYVALYNHEEILAVTPIGYVDKEYTLEEKVMAGFSLARHKRMELGELCNGLPKEDWPQWLKSALESARLAPSAVNRQPWRFTVKDDAVTISSDSIKDSFNISKRLDCGITMIHLEAGAYSEGVEGEWEYRRHPEIARFKKR